MIEPAPAAPIDWKKRMAERRANAPAMRERHLIEAREILNQIARMPANGGGTPFVIALQFNYEKLAAIQKVLRDWVERDSVVLLEVLNGR